MNFVLNRMSIINQKLDNEITREATRRVPDFARLMRLKKLRRAVKDKIARRIKLRSLTPQP